MRGRVWMCGALQERTWVAVDTHIWADGLCICMYCLYVCRWRHQAKRVAVMLMADMYGKKVSGRWQMDGRTVPACRTRWGVKRRVLVVVVESKGVHCCGSGGSGGGDDGAEDGPDDRLRRLRTGADC